MITGAIDIIQDGRLILRAKPVTATDADGAAIPASYAIEGSQLVVVVRTGGDTRFPILVDPVWQEFSGNAPTSPTGPGPWEGWVSSQGTSPSYFYAIQSGGAVNPGLNSAYYLFESAAFNPPQGATGGWAVAAPNFGLPGGTWIPRVDLINVNYNTTGHSSFSALTLGGGPASLPIWTRNGFTGPQGVQPFTSTAAFAYPTGLAFCPQYGGGNDTTGTTGPGLCDYDQPIGASIFTEYLTSFGGATGNDNAWFDGADVQFVDNTPPDQVSLTGIPTGWVQHGPTNAVVSGHDQGLGTSVVDVEVPKGTIYKFANGTCGYYQTGLPPAQPCQYSATGTMDLSGLPEGDYTVYGGAYDSALNVSYAPQQIKIDHTPPVVGTLTGSLATAAAAGQSLTLPVYSLTVPATDATSGVQSITAAINNCPGFTPAPANQGNPADGAPLTDQITLNALACTRGMHTLTVTATDRAGNTATTTLSFDLEPQSGGAAYFQYETQRLDDRMSLSENIGTGNLALTATDVSIAGTAGMNLNVTRTYNALGYPNLKSQAQADARDLSPGWRLSIGPDVHIDTANLPAGDVRYYDPTGGTHVFTPSGTAGQFNPARGLPATLTQNTATGTYALAFLGGGSSAFAAQASSTAPAPLARETDANGNSIIINYVPATCGSAVGCEISTIQGTQGQTLTFTYNGSGQVSQIQDTSGRKWQYNYDTNGNLNLYTDPTGAQTTYQYNATTDLLTAVTDPNGNTPGAPPGHTTTIIYTQNPATNQVASVTEPDGTTHGQVMSFAYLPNETDVTSPNGYGTTSGYVTKYLLDNFGRVVETTDPDGLATGTAWTQNTDGTASSTMTNAIASDPATGATTSTTYKTPTDYRATHTADQSGASNTCTYPSTGPNQYVPSSCTDDMGHVLNYTYDADNNLETTSGAVSGQTQTPVNLSYNAPNGALAGTLSQSVDGDNNKTVYKYNSLGQLVTTTPPAIAPPAAPLGNITNTYDAAGRLHSTTDGAGRTTTYAYDGDDRVLQTNTTGGGGGTSTLTYSYDGNGNKTSLTDGSGKTTYSPDQANRLVREMRPDGTAASYGYDEDDNLTSLNDGINDVEAFAYDAADRLQRVTATTPTGPESWAYAYQYSPPSVAMRVTGTTITDPNGIVEQDSLTNGQLTGIKYTGAAGPLTSFVYSYALPAPSTGVSSLIQSRTTGDGTTTTYGYDTFDRLTGAVSTLSGSQTASYAYSYDGASNRLSQASNGTTTTYSYNPGNELTTARQGATARAFTYDGSGNQLTDSGGESETYNQLDQTANFSGGTNLNPTYRGAGQGNRTTVVSGLLTGAVSPTDSSLGTTSIKNTTLLGLGLGGNDGTTPGNTQVIRDPSGNLLGLSVTSSLLNLGLGGSTTNLTYATDAQGSVAAVYDANQKAEDAYTYDPFGNTTVVGTENVPQPFRFQGAYEDATGLYHMGQRYYDPTTGRWLQPDPARQVADPVQSNAYAFDGDDPINGADPSGLSVNLYFTPAGAIYYGEALIIGGDASELLDFLPDIVTEVVGQVAEHFGEELKACGERAEKAGAEDFIRHPRPVCHVLIPDMSIFGLKVPNPFKIIFQEHQRVSTGTYDSAIRPPA